MNPLPRATILVIEDDDAIRRTLVDLLEVNGFQVVAASDGSHGLAAARRATPSLILTDLAMPGLTGLQLLEEFRRDEGLRTVPVIVITARIDRATQRRGMELGADDFITKPFSEEEVLRSIAARLEKKALLDELDAFAHTVAHDLRNPLATLCGRLELAGMGGGTADDAAQRHHLAEAAASARRLNDIIEGLLLLAGVRRQTVQPRLLDTAAIVTEAADRIADLLQRRGARIRLPDTWPAAAGHAPWVTEIWTNYISNAAKYGGEQPVITLGGQAAADGRSARFWVQDHGPGIEAAAQAKLFVPFGQIVTGRVYGHGLGLSIVRRIVTKLDGTVGVESTPGSGTRFWFELPATARIAPAAPFAAPSPLFAP